MPSQVCLIWERSFGLRVVPPSLLAAEKEEAKAVLTMFLKKQGLSNAVTTRTINKSDERSKPFIDHLVSRLHSVHKSRYLVGRELTTLEIRDALIPDLKTLLEEFGDILVDLVENFPNPPIKERSIEKLSSPPDEGRPVVPVSTPNTAVNSMRRKAVDRVTKVGHAGKLPPHVSSAIVTHPHGPSRGVSRHIRVSSAIVTHPHGPSRGVSRHIRVSSAIVTHPHGPSRDTGKSTVSTGERLDSGKRREIGSGFSQFKDNDKRVDKRDAKKNVSAGGRLDSWKRREIGSGFSSTRSKDENLVKKVSETMCSLVVNGKEEKRSQKGADKKVGKRKREKKIKVDSEETSLKVGLDMCSKNGDVIGALKLYDSVKRKCIKMGQYHYTVLLYLCSSAATGVVRPAKSGSGGRGLSNLIAEVSTANSEDLGEVGDVSNRNFVDTETNIPMSKNGLSVESINQDGIKLDSNGFPNPQVKGGTIQLGGGDYDSTNIKNGNSSENYDIQVSEDFKKYALQRGFEIYETMCLEKFPMNEASLTSVARMALAMGDGDMAFDTVKQMKALGINPRLRSYGPALSAFCNCGDVDKAFAVEEHMLEHGVHPEEPELEMLLRVSVEAGRSDKVYLLLHKLRTGVRKVSPSTADLLEKWFKSKIASKVGKRKLDQRLLKEAIENGGGGWHGQGWLGKGKWTVSRSSVGGDGLCKSCSEKLATIDLDPTETEKFAESVASIAAQREKNSSFQKFQKWLDYYGPFEAVVNAVVNGIRQLLPSKKWPLIVLHNRRITDYNMHKPANKTIVEKWKNVDALYATPTGSNDDWYWLYAAIKFKCLLVTNDEMRDHLFQLLGNDFFPKWKERHQVHFSFSVNGPVFHMPPPCSVVIQESEKGHWHIPIVSEHDYEGERIWLCVTRAKSTGATKVSAAIDEELHFPLHKKGRESSDSPTKPEAELAPLNHGDHKNRGNSQHPLQEICRNPRNLFSTAVFSKTQTVLTQIEDAEKLGGCLIDFEI
ncbi:proteinaceous RNase P 3 [Actinidia rufa]|uniref:ribonuclease P n=1 Tax=Actinidia rufa TaxID=165716 RepID=A0A7J0FJK6_9ERIC|nr:proteinaceous RNase P 3 [Actinidia rufa]